MIPEKQIIKLMAGIVHEATLNPLTDTSVDIMSMDRSRIVFFRANVAQDPVEMDRIMIWNKIKARSHNVHDSRQFDYQIVKIDHDRMMAAASETITAVPSPTAVKMLACLEPNNRNINLNLFFSSVDDRACVDKNCFVRIMKHKPAEMSYCPTGTTGVLVFKIERPLIRDAFYYLRQTQI